MFFSFASRPTQSRSRSPELTPRRARRRSSRFPAPKRTTSIPLGTTSILTLTPNSRKPLRHRGRGNDDGVGEIRKRARELRGGEARRIRLERHVMRVGLQLRVIRVDERHAVAARVAQAHPSCDERRVDVHDREPLDDAVQVSAAHERERQAILSPRRQWK